MNHLRTFAGLGVAVAFAFPPQLHAQAGGGHSHTAPHGGEVTAVAGHHVEFKADSSGAVAVWLLNAREKTVAPPAGTKLTLIAGAGEQVAVPLQVEAKEQRLVGRFDPAKLKSFVAVVSVPVDGKRHNVRFRYPHEN